VRFARQDIELGPLATGQFLYKHAIRLRILWGLSHIGSLAFQFRAKIMALHAATVGILIEKSKFEPEVALGVAEAIDLAMTQAQYVTVPILDARLSEIRSDLRVLEAKFESKLEATTKELKSDMQRLGAELEAKLVRWVFLVMLGNVALSLAANTLVNAFKSL
jgi:hypothetical protein